MGVRERIAFGSEESVSTRVGAESGLGQMLVFAVQDLSGSSDCIQTAMNGCTRFEL